MLFAGTTSEHHPTGTMAAGNLKHSSEATFRRHENTRSKPMASPRL